VFSIFNQQFGHDKTPSVTLFIDMKPLLLISSLFATLCLYPGNLAAQQNTSSNSPIAGKTWRLPLNEKAILPMSWIPAGTFVMGSPETEAGRKTDESPQTTVTLTKGYWIGNTEVTIGDWKAVTGMSVRDKVNKLLNDTTMYDFMGKRMLIQE
jgi:formylglycine-generating enzyme required for sulfatase activity